MRPASFTRRARAAAVALASAALLLAGCSTPAEEPAAPDGNESVTITDNAGEKTIPLPIESVGIFDNRTFELFAEWDIKPTVAARSLMPSTNKFAEDESILDVGSHREPNLDLIAGAAPDVIITGQRFAQYTDEIKELVPDAVIIELDPREGEPFDQELKRQVEVLGEIFDKKDEAAAVNAAFDESIERVKAAYDPATKVMAVTTSGGNIGYLAPTVGRTLGPAFDIFGFTPALEVEGASDDHQGDDISVEAIAQSNPDLILVMDRDAAVGADEEGYTPAADLLANNAALANVPAVQNDAIVIMPPDTYTNEGVQTYTEFFNDLADQLESAS